MQSNFAQLKNQIQSYCLNWLHRCEMSDAEDVCSRIASWNIPHNYNSVRNSSNQLHIYVLQHGLVLLFYIIGSAGNRSSSLAESGPQCHFIPVTFLELKIGGRLPRRLTTSLRSSPTSSSPQLAVRSEIIHPHWIFLSSKCSTSWSAAQVHPQPSSFTYLS